PRGDAPLVPRMRGVIGAPRWVLSHQSCAERDGQASVLGDRADNEGFRPSPLPPVCRARLPARYSSGTTAQRTGRRRDEWGWPIRRPQDTEVDTPVRLAAEASSMKVAVS